MRAARFEFGVGRRGGVGGGGAARPACVCGRLASQRRRVSRSKYPCPESGSLFGGLGRAARLVVAAEIATHHTEPLRMNQRPNANVNERCTFAGAAPAAKSSSVSLLGRPASA